MSRVGINYALNLFRGTGGVPACGMLHERGWSCDLPPGHYFDHRHWHLSPQGEVTGHVRWPGRLP